MIAGLSEMDAGCLPLYAAIPCAFEVRSRYRIQRNGLDGGGFLLEPLPLARPYTKDYDAPPGEGPLSWPGRFELARWAFFLAGTGDPRGGAAVTDTLPEDPGAWLWDIRVAPGSRGQGLGSALFRAAEAWARGRGHRVLRVETQDTNVPACDFYRRAGCALESAEAGAYPQVPGEARLVWVRRLD